MPSKPTHASQRGEMHRCTVVVASPSATDHGPELGLVATSHIDGGAVCGKSARTVLARGRVRGTARPTLQRHFSAGPSGAQPPENGLWAPSVTCRRSQPAAAARSTAWRGNARPGQAAQDGVGWRLRGFLVPGPRDGPTGKAGGGLSPCGLCVATRSRVPAMRPGQCFVAHARCRCHLPRHGRMMGWQGPGGGFPIGPIKLRRPRHVSDAQRLLDGFYCLAILPGGQAPCSAQLLQRMDDLLWGVICEPLRCNSAERVFSADDLPSDNRRLSSLRLYACDITLPTIIIALCWMT